MIWAKVGAAALIAWWLNRSSSAPATPKGEVSIGDDWSATFIPGSGQWSDAYRSPYDPSSVNTKAPETP